MGLLFIDLERGRRLRVSGVASIDEDDELAAEYPGAQFVVRVHVREVFPNCPRYIHRRVEASAFVPREGCETTPRPRRRLGSEMRYRIRRGVFRPLLALLGGTERGSYVDVGPAAVRFRFGLLFDEEVPRAALARACRSRWPWYGGIGWRLGALGVVGLIGSLDGVVEIGLREPHRVRVLGIPWRCRRIFVSLEDPGGFLRELAG